jgi:hypothetical protein
MEDDDRISDFHASGLLIHGPTAYFSPVDPLVRDADDCRASDVSFVNQY